jgi:hypothetical protein
MKYALIGVLCLLLGYGLYPILNKPSEKHSQELFELFKRFLHQEGSKYAEAQSAEEKLRAADAMYEKMMVLFLSQLELKGAPNRPIKIQVTIEPEKKVIVEAAKPEPVLVPQVVPSKLTIAEKIAQNKLDIRTFMSFKTLPELSGQDSRLAKLSGISKGKLKNLINNRTGSLEDISLVVNQDAEKKMTKLESIDAYDNTNLNFYRATSESFRSVPGDENLLLILIPGGSVVLDLKNYPTLTGKVFSLNRVSGEFELKTKAK